MGAGSRPAPIQVSHRRPAMVRSGQVATIWPTWVLSGTGVTSRFRAEVGVAISSRCGRERRQGGVVVDVGDGHLGMGGRSIETSCAAVRLRPAEVEEVVVDTGGRRRRGRRATGRVAAPRCRSARVASRRPAGRPGARAARRGRSCPRCGSAGRGRRRGAGPGQRAARPAAAPAAVSASNSRRWFDVPDQDRVPGRRSPDGRRRAGHPRQGEQGAVDLTELDPPSADLDLVVGAAEEEQPRLLVAHQVAAAVCALPTEGRHRRVLLGVLDRIEVAGQADPADDQLAASPLGRPGRLRRRPRRGPSRRAADRCAPAARTGQLRRAGDDGGLGRAVGVPDLPGRRRPAEPRARADRPRRRGSAAGRRRARPAATARPASAPSRRP